MGKETLQPPLFNSPEQPTRAERQAQRETEQPTAPLSVAEFLQSALQAAGEKQREALEQGQHFHSRRPYQCPEDDPQRESCQGISPYTELVQACRRTIAEVLERTKHVHGFDSAGKCTSCGQIRF